MFEWIKWHLNKYISDVCDLAVIFQSYMYNKHPICAFVFECKALYNKYHVHYLFLIWFLYLIYYVIQ